MLLVMKMHIKCALMFPVSDCFIIIIIIIINNNHRYRNVLYLCYEDLLKITTLAGTASVRRLERTHAYRDVTRARERRKKTTEDDYGHSLLRGAIARLKMNVTLQRRDHSKTSPHDKRKMMSDTPHPGNHRRVTIWKRPGAGTCTGESFKFSSNSHLSAITHSFSPYPLSPGHAFNPEIRSVKAHWLYHVHSQPSYDFHGRVTVTTQC